MHTTQPSSAQPRGVNAKRAWYFLLAFLLLAGVADAKVITVVPGQQTFAYGFWYFANCTTSLGVGSLSVNIQPKYGTVTTGATSGPIPGCPAGSPSLPLAASYYTMNISTPPPSSDYFQLEAFLNGQDLGPVDVYVVNGELVGKQLGSGGNYPGKPSDPNTPSPGAPPCGCNSTFGNDSGDSNTGGDSSGPAAGIARASGSARGSGVANLSGRFIALGNSSTGAASGNVYYSVTDYATAGQNPLSYARYYNSLANQVIPVYEYIGVSNVIPVPTLAVAVGNNWRSNYDRYLRITTSTNVVAERPDGQQLTFTLNGSSWIPDSDVDMTLVQNGNQWFLTDSHDTVETYNAVPLVAGASTNSLYAQLSSIQSRNGYTQNLAYSGGKLISVTDSYNRSLTLSYSGSLLQSVTTPDGLVISFGYSGTGTSGQLTSVSYSTSPATIQKYVYEDTALPTALTGVIDEDGNRFATWAYNASEQGISSQFGSNANLSTTVYTGKNVSTVTNAFGVQYSFQYTTLQGVPKVTEIDRAASSTTTAAKELFTYDSNGYIASITDWNGNLTTFTNNSHGEPTTVDEAVNSPVARITTTAYDARWVHLPSTIITPGLTATFTYDGSGEQLTKTLTDTTAQTVPYPTQGLTRTWTNTWSNYLLTSVKTPNGGSTSFGYDSTGAVTSVTDALSHTTKITSHTGGGLPLTVVDPNGVTATQTFDFRQRLTSRTVSGSTGTYITSWKFDAAGNNTQTTLPDGSYYAYTFDTAHRITGITDALKSTTAYTLDAYGDHTQTTIKNASGTVTWQSSDTFDALARLLTDTAGAGQTTTRTYDNDGNVLTITDGLKHTTTFSYDALSRPTTSTDANSGVTGFAFNPHDKLISVTDANSNITSYVRDGEDEVIQQVSPDSGTTVFHYDGDSNLTSKTDALGIVTSQSFDLLDRSLTTTYPSDPAENVAYHYDESASSFGIGRLTSVADAVGTLTRAYEERGNLVSEARVNGSATMTTGYQYDGASRVSGMTYPDSTVIVYQRDAGGYVNKVTATLPGAAAPTTLATLTHLPFGPLNAATYGNGVAESWQFDLSYRATGITDKLAATALQNLSYVYDPADNVKTITDAVNASNTQTLGYDAINRLTSATSGTGGYGSSQWTYDKVGNRLTQVQGTTTTTYGYTPGTNRLLSITPTTTHVLLQPSHVNPFDRKESHPDIARLSPGRNTLPVRAAPSETSQTHPYVFISMFGWPFILLGSAGVIGLRKRLLKSKALAILPLLFLLIGATSVLIGCFSIGGSAETFQPPTFSPPAGSYSSVQYVSISETVPQSAIYYTTDGTAPTLSSTLYTGPLTVSASETIRAIVPIPGTPRSLSASATYTITLPATATPVFTPAASPFSPPLFIAISDATAGATVYYTTDGSNPSASSLKYTAPIPVSATTTIQAIAIASGYANSAIASATYTLEPQAATPMFSPSGGSSIAAQSVTITDATPGAVVHYTTDNSAPSASSPTYTGPISVSGTETLSAIAIATGYANSAVARATYTINATCLNTVTTNANGNITNIPTADGMSCAVFTYNAANRAASVTGVPLATQYSYDFAGRRYNKTQGGLPPTVFSYAGGTLIAENNGGTVTDYVYVDGRPIATIQPAAAPAANQINYVLPDHLGTPQLAVNSNGTTTWSTAYQPFGTTGTISSSSIQNLRFPGQYADTETGFSYNLNRDYIPNLGRYLQADPIGLYGGINSYRYAYDNSMSIADKDGLCPLGYNCASEQQPGYVWNVQYCAVGCVGYTIDAAGYHYLDLGFGVGKWGESLTYTKNMQGFCQGLTWQYSDYGGGAGGNQDAGGFSATLPGASVTFGVPIEDITSMAQQVATTIENIPSQIYDMFYNNPFARTMRTVSQSLAP